MQQLDATNSLSLYLHLKSEYGALLNWTRTCSPNQIPAILKERSRERTGGRFAHPSPDGYRVRDLWKCRYQ